MVKFHTDDFYIYASRGKTAYLAERKRDLLQLFDGKDLGPVQTFCGCTIDRRVDSQGRNVMAIHLQHYWHKLFKKAGLDPHHPKATRPIAEKIDRRCCPPEVDAARRSKFLMILGSIMYGVLHCRFDLVFSAFQFARVMSNPAEKHMDMLMTFLAYIRTTVTFELKFYEISDERKAALLEHFTFYIFPDSSHGDDEATGKSTAGHFMFLQIGQGCVNGISHLQKWVGLSSTESEYMEVTDSCKTAAFSLQFLQELKMFKRVSFEVLEDSKPCISALHKDVTQSKFRHIHLACHYVKECIQAGWCIVTKIKTTEQVGDLATKALPGPAVSKFSKVVLGNGIHTTVVPGTGVVD